MSRRPGRRPPLRFRPEAVSTLEERQLLTGTFDLTAVIPIGVLHSDLQARMWTPSRELNGQTIHQTSTDSGPGWSWTQVVDQDMTSTNFDGRCLGPTLHRNDHGDPVFDLNRHAWRDQLLSI